MGWLFPHHCKKRSDIIKHSLETIDQTRFRLAKHCCVGNVLWVVVVEQATNTGLIFCCLLRRDGGIWGYKELDEASFPFCYTCPLAYLALAPVQSEVWRERVRLHHANRTHKLAVGQTVRLIPSCNVK